MRLTPPQNIRLIIEFDGTNYAGWQIQPDRPTVQGKLQEALQRLFSAEVEVYGCSRTDAGVSARNYVANFFAPGSLPVERIPPGLNFYLPRDIFVKSAEIVPPDFHARYSAKAKLYSYTVIFGRSPLRARYVWEYPYPVNRDRLKPAARLFIGKRDFNPFCHTREPNGICRITSIRIASRADAVTFYIRGDRFLYKMVRRMVGGILACAAGRLTVKQLRAALAGKSPRTFITAPARGLVLEQVYY